VLITQQAVFWVPTFDCYGTCINAEKGRNLGQKYILRLAGFRPDVISHAPCFSFRLMKGAPFSSKYGIWLHERKASIVNIFMFVSEIPNNSKALGFAATKRRALFVTTIASRALVSDLRNSFSLARSSFCGLCLLAMLPPSFASLFCACLRSTFMCSNPTKTRALNLLILPFVVSTIAAGEAASDFGNSFSLERSFRDL